MKRVILILISAIFVSCSNLETRDAFEEKIYQKQYDNWELETLELEIEKIYNYNQGKANLYKSYVDKRRDQEKALNELLEELRTNLKRNDITSIKEKLEEGFINNKIIGLLEEGDFSRANIVYGEIDFYKEKANNLVGIIFADQVVYLLVEYKLIDEKWRIVKIRNGE